MDFETFKDNLVKDVKEALDARTGGDTLVETRTVDKMNETYEAITVKPEDSIIGVNLNATALYKEYEDGRSYDSIVEGAADMADNALKSRPEFDVDAFSDLMILVYLVQASCNTRTLVPQLSGQWFC